MFPGGGRHFLNISGKLPRAGAKRGLELATVGAIASPPMEPKASGVGTKNTLEGGLSGPYKRALQGVQRSGLAAAAPVTGAVAGVDTGGSRQNWSTISLSPLCIQTRAPLHHSKAGTVRKHASTCWALDQSLGHWNHAERLRESPSVDSETTQTDLIVGTPEGGRKRQAKKDSSVGQSPCACPSQKNLFHPA